MKILIFTEGTALTFKKENSVHDYANYVPISKAVEKLTDWKNQRAIIYRGKTPTVKSRVLKHRTKSVSEKIPRP